MLIKYNYIYDTAESYWARLENSQQPNPKDEYGIVFGRIIDRQYDQDDIYDIPLARVIQCMQEGIVPEFQVSIPRSDTELIVDLVSKTWSTVYCTHDKENYEYIYSTESGDIMLSAFPEFLENGFWYRANDLNLDYDENPQEGEMVRKYVCEYGQIYLRYIAEHRKDFPAVPDEWLELAK